MSVIDLNLVGLAAEKEVNLGHFLILLVSLKLLLQLFIKMKHVFS